MKKANQYKQQADRQVGSTAVSVASAASSAIFPIHSSIHYCSRQHTHDDSYTYVSSAASSRDQLQSLLNSTCVVT